MITIDVAKDRREAIFTGGTAVGVEPVTFQVPELLRNREIHFGYTAWNYRTYLGGASTFSTEWIFYFRNAETMRLRFGNNGQWASGYDESRQAMPSFAALKMDPAAYPTDAGDPSNIPLLSGFVPPINPDVLYWAVQNSTSPEIQAGIFTAPLRFRASCDRVVVNWTSGTGTPWTPDVNTAGQGFCHFVLAVVSKA